MSVKQYDDSQYGVEKVLTLPSVDTSVIGVNDKFTLTENIIVTEFGCFVTTTMATNVTTVALQESAGASTIATVYLSTSTAYAAKTTHRQTTITNDTAASAGILVINVLSAATGAITPYIKYRARIA